MCFLLQSNLIILKYALLSTGAYRKSLIKKFLGFIFMKYKDEKNTFNMIIAEGVKSDADIDSIIQYCNEYDYFPSFIEALSQILIDSY